MSALGQKWTFTHLRPMSALPPKADIRSPSDHVRFVPKADISRSFDHLVGAKDKRLGKGDTDRFCGFAI